MSRLLRSCWSINGPFRIHSPSSAITLKKRPTQHQLFTDYQLSNKHYWILPFCSFAKKSECTTCIGCCIPFERRSFSSANSLLPHRLVHHPKLYITVHKKHHEWRAPVAIASMYSTPIEYLLLLGAAAVVCKSDISLQGLHLTYFLTGSADR